VVKLGNQRDLIYLLGSSLKPDQVTLGCSDLATIHDTVAGLPPLVDFDLERVCKLLVGFVRLVRSAHDCAEGGLAIALSEACSGALGAEINLGLTITQKNSHGAGMMCSW